MVLHACMRVKDVTNAGEVRLITLLGIVLTLLKDIDWASNTTSWMQPANFGP